MTEFIQTRQRSGAILSSRSSSSSSSNSRQPSTGLHPATTSTSPSSPLSNPPRSADNNQYLRSTSVEHQRSSVQSGHSRTTAPSPSPSSSQPPQSRPPMTVLRPNSGSSAATRMRSGSNPPPPLHRDLSVSSSDNLYSQRGAYRESSNSSSRTSSSTSSEPLVPFDAYSRSFLGETGDRHRASPGLSTGTFRNGEGTLSSGVTVNVAARTRAATTTGSAFRESGNMVAGAISSLSERSSSGNSNFSTKPSPPVSRTHSHSISVPSVYSSRNFSNSPIPITAPSYPSAAVYSPPPLPPPPLRYSTKPSSTNSTMLATSTLPNTNLSTTPTNSLEAATSQGTSPIPAASAVDLAGRRLREQQLQDRFKAAQGFIERTVGQPLPSNDLHESLKDGVILCRLANRLRPGTVEQISLRNLPFVKMENISNFLNAAKQLGVQSSDLFQTVDLYEGKDMNQVVSTILTLERVVGGVARVVSRDKRPGPNPLLSVGSTPTHIPKTTLDGAPAITRMRSKTAHAPSMASTAASIRPSSSSYYADQIRKLEEESIRFATGYDRLEATVFRPKDPRHQSTPVISQSTPPPVKDRIPRIPSTNAIEAAVADMSFGSDDYGSTQLEALIRQEQRDLVFGNNTSLVHDQSTSMIKSVSGPHLSVDSKASGLDMSRRRRKSISLDPKAANTIMGNPTYRDGLMSPGSPGLLTQSTSYNAISNLSTSLTSGVSSQMVNLKQHTRYASERTLDNKSRSAGSAASSRSTTPVQGLRKTANASEPVREKLELWENDVPVATFQLGNCIGRGQFGAVYKALNLGSGQMVAVKRIKIDGLKDDERDMLMQEVDLLKSLVHPSIVKYEGFIKTEGYLNIILEFVENGSLLTTLKSFGTFPEKLVVAYVVKILEGLVYLHGKEVVHCDLKAANILTTKNGNVKLSDFGVSLNLKVKESDFGAVAGTPNWMAPEVIELKGASPASDIWSLGCTVIEMLTGRPPYADLLAMTTLFRIVEDERPPLPNNLSMDLLDFLCQCFQKDPTLRPSAGALGRHIWIKRNFAARELKPVDSLPYMKRKLLEPKDKVLMAAVEEGSVASAKRASTPLGLSSGPPPTTSATTILQVNGRGTRRGSIDSASAMYASSTVPAPTQFAEKYQEMRGLKTDNHHQFVKSSFAKPVECRLCHDFVKKQAVICQDCSMVFHRKCQFYVGNTCFPGPHLSYFQTPTPAQSVPDLKMLANEKSKGSSRPTSRASQIIPDDRSRSVTPSQAFSSRPCPTPPLLTHNKRGTTTINEAAERQRKPPLSPHPTPPSAHRAMSPDNYPVPGEQPTQSPSSRPSSRQSESPTSPTFSGLRNFIAGPRRFSFSSKKTTASVGHPLPTPSTSNSSTPIPTTPSIAARQQTGTPDLSKDYLLGHSGTPYQQQQQQQRQAPTTPPKTLPVPIMMGGKSDSAGRAFREREYQTGGPLDVYANDQEVLNRNYNRSYQRPTSGSNFSTSAPLVPLDIVGGRSSRNGRQSAASNKLNKYDIGDDENQDEDEARRGDEDRDRGRGLTDSESDDDDDDDDDDDVGHEDIDDMDEEDLEALLVPSIARRTPRSSIDAGLPVLVTNGMSGGHHRAKSQSFGQVLTQQQTQTQPQPQQQHYMSQSLNRGEVVDGMPSRPMTSVSFGASPVATKPSSRPSSRLQQELQGHQHYQQQQHQQQHQQQPQQSLQAGRTAQLSNGYSSSGSSSAALTSSYSSLSNNSSSASSLGSSVAALLEEEERMMKELHLHHHHHRQSSQPGVGKNGMLDVPSALQMATSPPQSHHVGIRTMLSRFSASSANDNNNSSNSTTTLSSINNGKEVNDYKGSKDGQAATGYGHSSGGSRGTLSDRKEQQSSVHQIPLSNQYQQQQQHYQQPRYAQPHSGMRSIHPQQSSSHAIGGGQKSEFAQGYDRIQVQDEYMSASSRVSEYANGATGVSPGWRASSPGRMAFSGYSGVPSSALSSPSSSLGLNPNANTAPISSTSTAGGAVSALKRGGKVIRRSMGAALEKERWD